VYIIYIYICISTVIGSIIPTSAACNTIESYQPPTAPASQAAGPVGTGKTMLMNLFDEHSREAQGHDFFWGSPGLPIPKWPNFSDFFEWFPRSTLQPQKWSDSPQPPVLGPICTYLQQRNWHNWQAGLRTSRQHFYEFMISPVLSVATCVATCHLSHLHLVHLGMVDEVLRLATLTSLCT
jgi:hypothetical protein